MVAWITAMTDGIARLLGRQENGPEHLRTGRKGEVEAYYFLRQQGYTMVARNWRVRGEKGEIDLIGWEGGMLCFVEVKTRTSHAVKPAEAAVDRAKQHEVCRMAAQYLRRLNRRPPCRFDVVSVYLEPGKRPEIQLFKGAFGWRNMSFGRS